MAGLTEHHEHTVRGEFDPNPEPKEAGVENVRTDQPQPVALEDYDLESQLAPTKRAMGQLGEVETLSLESFDRDAFERDSADLLWKELQVGEYHIWLRGGLHYEVNWQYGFQHQPRDQPHGPMKGPIFEQPPPQLPFDFDLVKALALEAVRADGLVSAQTSSRLRNQVL